MGYIGATPYGIGTGSAQFPPTQSPYFQPFQSSGIGGYGLGVSPAQQILQFLQIVPQQLQQLQILQQQQIFHLQQLLHLIPVQIQQLQQLVQGAPQQSVIPQPQWQPPGPAVTGPFGFGAVPPSLGQTPGQVM